MRSMASVPRIKARAWILVVSRMSGQRTRRRADRNRRSRVVRLKILVSAPTPQLCARRQLLSQFRKQRIEMFETCVVHDQLAGAFLAGMSHSYRRAKVLGDFLLESHHIAVDSGTASWRGTFQRRGHAAFHLADRKLLDDRLTREFDLAQRRQAEQRAGVPHVKLALAQQFLY